MRGLQVSPVEIVRMYLDRIEEINSATNAVVTLCAERAMADAKAAESGLINGEARPLTGLPFTVKDTIETAGVRTTAGSKLREKVVPQSDAPVVARFLESGAILLGKTNTSEFAMTFGTDNALFGRTDNPWNSDLTPGGSSGGEAALIAAGGSPIGLASDLGGSIRIPAHFCGVCGLRPTVGVVPFRGHVPDLPGPLGKRAVIGPMARHIDDLNLALGIIGTEGRLLEPEEVGAVAYFVENGVAPVMVETADAVRSATGALEQDGFNVEHVSPPGLAGLFDCWNELWHSSGGAKGLLAGLVTDASMLSPALGRLVEASPPGPDADLEAGTIARVAALEETMAEFFERHPIALCPVASGPATRTPGRWDVDGEETRGIDGFSYSLVWSVLGYPALTLPWRLSDRGTPIGIQIVARPFHDREAIEVARALERIRGDFPAPGLVRA